MARDLQKERDAESLHLRVRNAKIQAFDYMQYLIALTPAELKSTGHASIEAGLLFTMKLKVDQIKAMSAQFIKMYPD
jgi:hypothetical protein